MRLRPDRYCRLGTDQGRTGPDLLEAIDAALVVDPLVEARFRIPQSEGAVLAALEAGAVVSEKNFAGNLVLSDAHVGQRLCWNGIASFASEAEWPVRDLLRR